MEIRPLLFLAIYYEIKVLNYNILFLLNRNNFLDLKRVLFDIGKCINLDKEKCNEKDELLFKEGC